MADVSTHATLPTGLVAYYTLDEASGTRSDSKGTKHLTDNNTVTSTTGKQGNGAFFTAANSEYLSASDTGLPTGNYSVSFWVKSNDTPVDYNNILQWGTFDFGKLVWITLTSAGKVLMSNYGSSFSSATTVLNNAWHHVVLTRVGSAMKFYIDGNTTADASGTWGTDPVLAGLFELGQSGVGGYFDGALDELGIWSKELSSTEITDLYNGGSGLPYSSGTPPAPSVTPRRRFLRH